jgi:hypothetical protein
MMKPPVGSAVTFNGSNFYGLLDANDVTITADGDRGEVVGTVIELLVRTLDVPNVRIDDPITVEGVAYRVRHPIAMNDGALVKLLLRRDE